MTRPVARSSQDSLARPYRERTLWTVEGCIPSRYAILAGPHRLFTRRATMRRSRRRGVRPGDDAGLLERSPMPDIPNSRYLLAQRAAVGTDT